MGSLGSSSPTVTSKSVGGLGGASGLTVAELLTLLGFVVAVTLSLVLAVGSDAKKYELLF